MKVSLNWIKEFVDLPKDITPDKLAHDLTMATVEVEEVIDQGKNFAKLVVGKVVELKAHPNADKLKLAMTDIGEGEIKQIVCGGINLFEGILVCVALPGAKVRWHGTGDLVELSPVKIRGQESFGMICAAEEVGLGNILPNQEGEIMNISFSNVKPGTKIAELFELDDVIFYIDNKSLTNRPDLWGHYGLAREVAAIYKLKLKSLPTDKIEVALKDKIKIKIKSRNCYRYLGTVVNNVKVGPSPAWLKRRLQAVGQNSINNIVDLTNYVMFELGEPTHAFDYTKLESGQIIVRQANAGEPIKTLDEEKLKLKSGDLVVADIKKPIALAGIIGGIDSGISEKTSKIVLEAATFDPVSVRRTSQKYGIRTESSIRFEKGIDTERAEIARQRMLQLLVKLQPDCQIGPTVDEVNQLTEPARVEVELDFINNRLGRQLTVEEISRFLEALQFSVKVKGSKLQIIVPIWRSTGDVSLPEDIVEEVARLYGYDNLDFIPLTVKLKQAIWQPSFTSQRRIKEYLALVAGMNEVFNYPWVDKKYLELFGLVNKDLVTIINSPADYHKFLIPSLLPGLAVNIGKNLKYFDKFKIFEIARVFINTPDNEFTSQPSKNLPYQPKKIAGAVVAGINDNVFIQTKGIWQGLMEWLNIYEFKFVDSSQAPGYFNKARCLGISLKGKVIGYLGELQKTINSQLDFKDKAVCFFEVDFYSLPEAINSRSQYQPLPLYPLVIRDLAVVLDSGMSWQNLKKEILKASKLVKKVELFDVYSGSKVPVHKKSVAFSVLLGSDHTLATTEIEREMEKIMSRISEVLGGKLRDF